MLHFPKNLLIEERSNQKICFYGTHHQYDPSREQFEDIASLWSDFIQTGSKKKIALGEIPVPKNISDDLSEAIKIYGEAGAHYWHARSFGVATDCPEPDQFEQRISMLKAFDSSLVFYALTVQNLAGWFKNRRDRTFEEAINFTIQREVGFANIYNMEPTREVFIAIHKKLFPNQELQSQDFLQRLSDPRRRDSGANLVIGHKTKFRNDYILQRINELQAEGQSVFIVYGLGHLEALKESIINSV